MNMPSSIHTEQVLSWLDQHHQLTGELTPLVGDVDHNFCLTTESGSQYTVKISCSVSSEALTFESALLNHLCQHPVDHLQLPQPVLDQQQLWITPLSAEPQTPLMRVLSWVDGHLWSQFRPHNPSLIHHLGAQMARLDKTLEAFDHPKACREFSWDLAQCLWIKDHLSLHCEQQKALLNHFIDLFECHLSTYQKLRQQVIHNDLNDNNVLVSMASDSLARVTGFIDFGDAVHSQLINEVAIAAAYVLMDQPDPLEATVQLLRGYHQVMPLLPEELPHLYQLIGMRLAVSVTQAAIARQQAPENAYKSISEQPAWDLLERWQSIHPEFAHFRFREACGLLAHPQQALLKEHLQKQAVSLTEVFPEHSHKKHIHVVDLSVGSTLLGNAADYENHALQLFQMHQLQNRYPGHFLLGGYLEPRSFYASEAFSTEGNTGREYRTIHLGLDVWLDAGTAIHAPLSGVVVGLHDNDHRRDYGPTLILEHRFLAADQEVVFYSLYGHLSRQTLQLHITGDEVKAGQLLAWTGEDHENGGWSPHLHFQLMHDLLGHEHDFPGACTPNHQTTMQSLCPNPEWLFKESSNWSHQAQHNQALIDYRQKHLGKSLSLSYSEPLQMLRGDDVYLLDQWGQKYLDTCNNVAHVGHEHPTVVTAGQEQMAVLNTNSRYLHPAVVRFTEALLETLPAELSVVHLVNSGSEANELALRMAKACSGEQDVIALESGYHGNSNACIDISSYKFDGHGGHGAPQHTHIVPLPDTFRGLYRTPDAGAAYAGHVAQVIQQLETQGRRPAAFIAESIVSCGGQIELPDGFLQQVYQSVRAAGGVCIADEVQVGCGRIGSHFWAFEAHGVVPDILTIGKPIGNGHPLAVVVCTRKVADQFANGMEYFNTFGGNPVSATIGLAVLRVIKQQSLQQRALEVGDHLKQQLMAFSERFPLIKDVRGQGLFLGFELCDEQLQPAEKQAAYLANRMRELGILISTDGPDHNVIKIKPPMTMQIHHADELLQRLEQVFNETAMQA
ncbi:aminotransferase class III-fold pyridoxal phosphate-dependent enzyme [Marinicella sediminis]|uniref:Aminotransferase class III-fold pyridoxal phosphate-dependent enzyme n=1 Tax=Marinicella sediminis TaxID=1792834 RepID=A0ABV7J9Y4_9GAMM|nr:aminotransferase class III-fold pyridoxal phosphate-dependent enzyme [Marinicella sediminis]